MLLLCIVITVNAAQGYLKSDREREREWAREWEQTITGTYREKAFNNVQCIY